MTVDQRITDAVLGHGILFDRLFDDAAIFPPGTRPCRTR
jgi:hypothetical protein